MLIFILNRNLNQEFAFVTENIMNPSKTVTVILIMRFEAMRHSVHVTAITEVAILTNYMSNENTQLENLFRDIWSQLLPYYVYQIEGRVDDYHLRL